MRTYQQDNDLPQVVNASTPPTDLTFLTGNAPIFFQVEGTFSGNYTPEISVDGGTSWEDAGKILTDVSTGNPITDPIVGPVVFFSKTNLPFFRLRCTGFTSAGSPTPRLHIRGQDSRST